MKNKTVKILTIISMIIVVFGILYWFGTDTLINENDSFTFLLSLFGSIALRLLVVICTIGTIALIWLIYGIIILVKKIKKGKFKKRNFVIVLLFGLLVIVSSVTFFSIVNNGKINIMNKNYDYSIKYTDDMNTYTIYQRNKRVEVHIEEQVICVKAPCPTIKRKEYIKFSNKNMAIINNFINKRFENYDYNSIQIFKENLNSDEMKILDSIIYNDEEILNN